ncbi:hypothetical protein F5Y19DRAFT_432014 [Xylariaceae sp. FL1651]|nr:hypothetical protein F5Y19DRAFT_432014 [Xylariaceae sp. FL1651]
MVTERHVPRLLLTATSTESLLVSKVNFSVDSLIPNDNIIKTITNMVVSTAKQLEGNYQLWHRFSFPTEHRAWDAVAVPGWVGDQLNSAYAIIISTALIHFWTVIISLILYFSLRRYNNDASKLDPLAATIWNKRADLVDSVIETIAFNKADWTRPWVPIAVFLALAAWVAQTATGVVVPPLIILDHAAPVKPQAIYAPDNLLDDNRTHAARFALEVPRFSRALGSAVVDEDLRQKVNVSLAEQLGQTDNGEEILRINYSYGVSGADLGIQKYFDLTLNVTGSCITEYGWYYRTDIFGTDKNPAAKDYYNLFGDQEAPPVEVSLLDGPQPSATFYVSDGPIRGTIDGSNTTWAAIVSSVNRSSFSPGADPWYLTETALAGTGAQYSVRLGRPALSCWQDDVWTFRGRKSTISALTSDALPGLGLSESLQGILAQYLSAPMIFQLGYHLQSSALLSSTTALVQIFDASASSIHNDLERLVLAAYVATTNCLTDTTLYPTGAESIVPNIQRGDNGQVPDDAAGFVVWSPDVATLSIVVIIAIPTIFVSIWFIAIVLLYWTPVKIVTVLDSSALQEDRKSHSASNDVVGDDNGEARKDENQPEPAQ